MCRNLVACYVRKSRTDGDSRIAHVAMATLLFASLAILADAQAPRSTDKKAPPQPARKAKSQKQKTGTPNQTNPLDAKNVPLDNPRPVTTEDFERYGIYEQTAPRPVAADPVATSLPLQLQPGDQIQIGQSVLVFSGGRAPETADDLAEKISIITRQDVELSSAIIKTVGEAEGSAARSVGRSAVE